MRSAKQKPQLSLCIDQTSLCVRERKVVAALLKFRRTRAADGRIKHFYPHHRSDLGSSVHAGAAMWLSARFSRATVHGLMEDTDVLKCLRKVLLLNVLSFIASMTVDWAILLLIIYFFNDCYKVWWKIFFFPTTVYLYDFGNYIAEKLFTNKSNYLQLL